jgi:hypothetical protein
MKKCANIFKKINTKCMKEFKTTQAKFKGLLGVVDTHGYVMSPPLLNIDIHMNQTTKEWWKNTAKIKSN